jgi:hypothetical protein
MNNHNAMFDFDLFKLGKKFGEMVSVGTLFFALVHTEN